MTDLPPAPDPDQADGASDWLDSAERRVVEAAVPLAETLGWSRRLADAALREAGVGRGEASLVLPGGERDLAALLSRRHDRRALEALGRLEIRPLKVRGRIHAAVAARIEAAMADEAAVRRANGFLALPLNAPLALRLAWESADVLWRWAGDVATDENHYSKRAILAGVLISTLAARLRGGQAQAETHLAARIEQVMAFEKWKAKLPRPSAAGEAVAAWLGRARYGARTKAPKHRDASVDRLPSPKA